MIESYYDVADIAELIKVAVAPVFLLTGIGSFINVLSIRIARLVDRARRLETLIEAGQAVEISRVELKVQLRRLKLAGSAAMAMSQAQARPTPPPRAAP